MSSARVGTERRTSIRFAPVMRSVPSAFSLTLWRSRSHVVVACPYLGSLLHTMHPTENCKQIWSAKPRKLKEDCNQRFFVVRHFLTWDWKGKENYWGHPLLWSLIYQTLGDIKQERSLFQAIPNMGISISFERLASRFILKQLKSVTVFMPITSRIWTDAWNFFCIARRPKYESGLSVFAGHLGSGFVRDGNLLHVNRRQGLKTKQSTEDIWKQSQLNCLLSVKWRKVWKM